MGNMDGAGSGTTNSKLKFLFLNADSSKPQCAVYQAGKIYAEALKLCETLEIRYVDVPAPAQDAGILLNGWDGIIFNYQHVTMQMLGENIFKLPLKRVGFFYEARSDPWSSPMHFNCWPMDAFDTVISPDPTLSSTERCWGVPRVIPRNPAGDWIINDTTPTPIISTYGFPSPWKDLTTVIQMINEEYDTATFRMNFGHASHQENTELDRAWGKVCEELTKLAKPGIKVQFTRNYMSDEKLISWLASSDLNIFLASPVRGRITGGALLASTDLAITARAPIMVSDTVEARHLEGLKFKTLHEAIQKGGEEVRRLYNLWSPKKFAARIDELVREYWQ